MNDEMIAALTVNKHLAAGSIRNFYMRYVVPTSFLKAASQVDPNLLSKLVQTELKRRDTVK